MEKNVILENPSRQPVESKETAQALKISYRALMYKSKTARLVFPSSRQ